MPSPTTVLLRTQSDERLVALARAGHERAFEAIVERYRRPLVRACRRVLPEARAEDAVQQALVAAWTGLSRGDEVRELRPWLYRIAHNTALNQLRISGYDYDELQGLLDAGPAPEEELERREIARRTLTGLAALPPRQREALLQIAVQGRGQEEVARTLGVSEPAVRQLVHRARTQLRAAATALTPMPLAGWFADMGGAAGGAAGVAAAAAKVGAVVVLAGGAAAGPGVVDRLAHGSRVGSAAPAIGAAEAKASESDGGATGPGASVTTESVRFLHPVSTPRVRTHSAPTPRPVSQRRRATPVSGTTGGGRDRSGRGDDGDDEVEATEDHSGSGSSGGDGGDSSGSGSSGRDGGSSGSGSSGDGGSDDSSGPGGGGSDDVAPEPTVSADDSHSGRGDDEVAIPVLTPTVTASPDSSHSGSGGGDDDLRDDSRDGSLDQSSAG